MKWLWRRHSTGRPGEEKLHVGLSEEPHFTCSFGMDDHQTCFEGPKPIHVHHTCEKNRCRNELPSAKTSLYGLCCTWEQPALSDSTFQPQKSEMPAEVLSTGSPFQTGTGEVNQSANPLVQLPMAASVWAGCATPPCWYLKPEGSQGLPTATTAGESIPGCCDNLYLWEHNTHRNTEDCPSWWKQGSSCSYSGHRSKRMPASTCPVFVQHHNSAAAACPPQSRPPGR